MARNHPACALRSALVRSSRPSVVRAAPAALALALGLAAACTTPVTQTDGHTLLSKSERIRVHVDPKDLELAGNQVLVRNAQYDLLIDRDALEAAMATVLPQGHTGFQVTGGVSFGQPTAGGISTVNISEIEIEAGSDSTGTKWNIVSAEVHSGSGEDYAEPSSATRIAQQSSGFFPPYRHKFKQTDYSNVANYSTADAAYWVLVKVELSNANGSTTAYAGKIYDLIQDYPPKPLPDVW